MQYEEFRRVVCDPFWARNPWRWTTTVGMGISFYAEEGRVGMFNLSWLLLNVDKPPAVHVYRSRDMGWVPLNAQKLLVAGLTLEHQAATLPLWAFCALLQQDRATYNSLALKCLLSNGLRKLEHDPRHQRAS